MLQNIPFHLAEINRVWYMLYLLKSDDKKIKSMDGSIDAFTNVSTKFLIIEV